MKDTLLTLEALELQKTLLELRKITPLDVMQEVREHSVDLVLGKNLQALPEKIRPWVDIMQRTHASKIAFNHLTR